MSRPEPFLTAVIGDVYTKYKYNYYFDRETISQSQFGLSTYVIMCITLSREFDRRFSPVECLSPPSLYTL